MVLPCQIPESQASFRFSSANEVAVADLLTAVDPASLGGYPRGPRVEGGGEIVPILTANAGLQAVDYAIWGGGAGLLVIAVAVVAVLALRGRVGRPGAEIGVAPPEGVGQTEAPLPASPLGLAAYLREALHRTRAALQGRFDAIFGRERVDDSLFVDLEEALITADVGVTTTELLVGGLRDIVKAGEQDRAELRVALRNRIRELLVKAHRPMVAPAGQKPWVILVVGVNGSGKTTTIGKLASRFRDQGLRVMMAAGDTYRAAAADQLAIWAERAGADIVCGAEGADPGSVVYDALSAAVARGHDVVLVDTAGRLQTARPLMEQLTKLRRVISKVQPTGPHDTLLVLDGTMGQNGLSQARLFHEAAPLTGVVVTKLDGTAKGGMVLTLSSELGLPVQFIGVGEKVTDLRAFEPDAFAEALA